MRAIYIQQHGAVADLKVSEVPAPSIRAGEVLVNIEASGINPSDVASVQGRFPGSVLPRIVGRNFAGKVVEGPVDLIGTEVWGTGGDLGISRDGTHAEYVDILRQAVARRPRNLSAEEAAIVGVPFCLSPARSSRPLSASDTRSLRSHRPMTAWPRAGAARLSSS